MTVTEQMGQKAFELRDARDMMEKLRWEINKLFFRQRYDITACQYHSFNCAVTAWHTVDWLWHSLSADLQSQIGVASLRDFQAHVRSVCPALKLCELICNGSKHRLLTQRTNPSVSAKISDGEGHDYGNPIIVEGDTEHLADKMFYEALFWFRAFIHQWNVFPEEPFVPMGDAVVSSNAS
jgi:hypothetical protein